MPKFLDDIKFIDSQGHEHNVSEYNNQIRTQGHYYTGDSEFERFIGDMPDTNIPVGEISKQGKYFTGLNADKSGNVQDGLISDQGKILTGLELDEINDVSNSAKVSEGKISIQGDYYTGLNAVGESLSGVPEGEISEQGSYYTGLNADGSELSGEDSSGEDSSGIPVGEISKQGAYYTGLNADESGKVTSGKISQQGNYQYNRVKQQGDTQDARIIEQGTYYTDTTLISEGNTEYGENNKHSTYQGIIPNQGAYYTGLNADGTGNEKYGEIYKQGEKWKNEFDEFNLINRVGDLENFEDNHNNIENGEGQFSIQTASPEDSLEEDKNKTVGEYCAVFGKSNNVNQDLNLVNGFNNTVESDNSLVSGYQNVSWGGKQFISGVYNNLVGSAGGVVGNANQCGTCSKDEETGEYSYSACNNNFVVGVQNTLTSDRKPESLERLSVVQIVGDNNMTPLDMTFDIGSIVYPEVNIYSILSNKTYTKIAIEEDGIYLGDNEEAAFKWNGEEWDISETECLWEISAVSHDIQNFFSSVGSSFYKFAGYATSSYRGTFVSGYDNTVLKSSYSAIIGESHNVNSSSDSLIAGKINTSDEKQNVLLFGERLTATRNRQAIVGLKNDLNDVSSTFVVAYDEAGTGRNLLGVGPDKGYFNVPVETTEGIKTDTISALKDGGSVEFKFNGTKSLYINSNGSYFDQPINANAIKCRNNTVGLTLAENFKFTQWSLTGAKNTAISATSLLCDSLVSNKTVYAPIIIVKDVGNLGLIPRIAIGDDKSANYVLKSSEIDDRILAATSPLATKATTLAGYGITDAYTKEEITEKFSGTNDDIKELKESIFTDTNDVNYTESPTYGSGLWFESPGIFRVSADYTYGLETGTDVLIFAVSETYSTEGGYGYSKTYEIKVLKNGSKVVATSSRQGGGESTSDSMQWILLSIGSDGSSTSVSEWKYEKLNLETLGVVEDTNLTA